MRDAARVGLAAVLGAAVGGLAGYLYLTEGGRRLRRDLEPRVDRFLDEVRRLRTTVDRARQAAHEGRHALGSVLAARGDVGDPNVPPWAREAGR
jgi:hypothetical protein